MAPLKDYEQYQLLDSENDESCESLPDGKASFFQDSRSILCCYWRVLTVLLSLPLCFVAGFVLGMKLGSSESSEGVSAYMKLSYAMPSQIWWNTEYSDVTASESEIHKLWDTGIPWETGIIALSDEEARAMDLPESQPFPWDSHNKRLYIVNAHHILHCVRNVYISIQQYRTNTTQTIDYQHILHCLDSLRVETMCTADDTLRYVPLNSAQGYRPGDGQRRQCRDWSKVQEFVEAHDPCYRYLKPGDKAVSNLERFKFCPPDSQYLPNIRKYFGFDGDWSPEPQEGPQELNW